MYHFINCLALTFLPHVILYRATKLMEESGFRSCVFSAIGYAATQAVKMLVMATILPSSHHEADPLHTSTPSITLSQEILQSLVQIVELIGIQLTLQMAPNLSKFSTHARILAVAIGWSFAESVAFYLVPLWIGARGMEFSWQYIELGLSSNVNLVIHFAFIAAVWLRTRTDLQKAAVPVVYAILLLGLTLPSITQYALHVLGINSWAVLGARALVGVSCAGMVHLLLSQYSSRPGANKYKNN